MDAGYCNSNLIEIEALLLSTRRKGIEDLVNAMKDAGYFEAPCSGSNHLAEDGGLAQHSLNVYRLMKELAESWCVGTEVTDESIILCSLLHDLGKMGDHGKPNYVENILRDGKRSEKKPYETNKDLLYLPHEVRSVCIAERYIQLTEDEEWAITCHNGLYGDFRYVVNGKETPLYMLLHFADMWASRVVEGAEDE